MLETINKRCSNPVLVQQFFQAIEFIRRQRQIANIPRIVKYMEREFSSNPVDTLQNLHNAVIDGLVIETITVGCKGTKAGVEQEGYWIPDKEQMLYDKEGESHDWYCFLCHTSGKVLVCSSCPFVYHPDCLDKIGINPDTSKNWICPSCTSIVKVKKKSQHDELGRCLNCIVNQKKELAGDLNKDLDKQAVFHDFFLYSYYDLNTLNRDCQKGLFSSTEEFRSKVKLIHHNYSIMFGEKHKYTRAAKQLVETCEHEIQELSLCKSCFFLSNTKPMKEWFCQPCDPPHQVVWAKQKGFDFWPAKIIQIQDDRIDVRFFGKHHPRAWVPIDAVRCITVSPSELRIKRKQHWKQSSNEMKEYIRQCECALGKDEACNIIRYDSPYGIGKSQELIDKMRMMTKEHDMKLSSLNFDLVPTKSKKLSSEIDSLSKTRDELNESEESFVEVKQKGEMNGDFHPEVVTTHAQKRQADGELNSSEAKAIKTEACNGNLQVEERSSFDKQIQVNPNDFDGNACNCKMRYGKILQKFKDYVIQSHRLEKGKLIRAAAFKAAYEQRQVEDQTRKDVTAEFEEVVSMLKNNHQKLINEIKMKQWCRVCQDEATLYCCQNTNYCSNKCKEVDYEAHKSVCRCLADSDSSGQRSRRVIKPKLF